MSARPFANGHKQWRTPEQRAELREKLRAELFQKQGGLCWLCKEPMSLQRGKFGRVGRKFASFDHVVPKSNGGTTYYTNLKLAHRMCNSARRVPSENGSNGT